MEVCHLDFMAFVTSDNIFFFFSLLDVHLRNVLVKLPSSIDRFSIGQLIKNMVSLRQSPLQPAMESRSRPMSLRRQ